MRCNRSMYIHLGVTGDSFLRPQTSRHHIDLYKTFYAHTLSIIIWVNNPYVLPNPYHRLMLDKRTWKKETKVLREHLYENELKCIWRHGWRLIRTCPWSCVSYVTPSGCVREWVSECVRAFLRACLSATPWREQSLDAWYSLFTKKTSCNSYLTKHVWGLTGLVLDKVHMFSSTPINIRGIFEDIAFSGMIDEWFIDITTTKEMLEYWLPWPA